MKRILCIHDNQEKEIIKEIKIYNEIEHPCIMPLMGYQKSMNE